MKKIAETMNISFDNLYSMDNGIQYFKCYPRIRGRKLLWYSSDNINKKPEFTIYMVSRQWIKHFLNGKVYKLKFKYNFQELFKSQLPYHLFNQMFGIKEGIEIVDPKNNNEKIMRHHAEGESYYLFINNKALIAMISKDGVNNVIPIPEHWKSQFVKYSYLCNHKLFP
jgi:hypothetical protein